MRHKSKGSAAPVPRDLDARGGFHSTMGRSSRNLRRLALASSLALLCVLGAVGSGLAAVPFDPGFGNRGVSETPLPAEERQLIFELGQGPLISDLATLPRGGAVAAVGSGTENEFFGAASFRVDGTLDKRFGSDGFIRAAIFPALVRYTEPQAQGVAVQRDGKVVLVGYREGVISETPAPIAMRLRPNGSPDRSFGDGGLVAPEPHGGRADVLHAVAIQQSGRIIAVGARNERNDELVRQGQPAGLVIAYRPDGRIDRSFGDGGRVLFAGREERITYTGLFDVSVLPSGRILVVGYRNNRLLVARLTAKGKLDRSFGGGDGSVSIGLGLENFCCPEAASIAALATGGTVVLADAKNPGVWLVRLRRDGGLDRTFGRGGIVKRGIARQLSRASDVAIEASGRIVAAGVGYRRRNLFTVLRFRPDGRPDRSFGKGGVKSLPRGRDSAAISAVTLPNGQVVVGGGAQYQRNDRLEYSLLLARLRR